MGIVPELSHRHVSKLKAILCWTGTRQVSLFVYLLSVLDLGVYVSVCKLSVTFYAWIRADICAFSVFLLILHFF